MQDATDIFVLGEPEENAIDFGFVPHGGKRQKVEVEFNDELDAYAELLFRVAEEEGN